MNAEIGKRPFVTANFALTWDGRISTRRSTPADFSSKSDKRRLVEIRARCDAVLVSAKTVAADNMSMGLPDAALRAARSARGQREYPLRVLLTNSGRIDPALRLFTKTFSPIVIFSTTRMPAPRSPYGATCGCPKAPPCISPPCSPRSAPSTACGVSSAKAARKSSAPS